MIYPVSTNGTVYAGRKSPEFPGKFQGRVGSLVNSWLPFPLFHLSDQAKRYNNPGTAPPASLQSDLFAPRQEAIANRRFVVIGDPGSGKKGQHDVAAQMEKLYREKPFASVLVLGDNVYEHGEPKYFAERIHKPYKTLFDEGVRFYPVLGNHDVTWGFGQDQLKYWGAPPFYSFKLGAPGNQVEIFALDTTIMMPGVYDCYTDNPKAAEQRAEFQKKWLEKALAESTADMKVVMGHYPVYSSGVHALLERTVLRFRRKMEPILTNGNVDLYLAGHEHHYERSKPIKGVQYIVSGAAGKLFKATLPLPINSREKIAKQYHFMVFEVTPNGLLFQAISKDGGIIDSGLIRKRLSEAQKPDKTRSA